MAVPEALVIGVPPTPHHFYTFRISELQLHTSFLRANFVHTAFLSSYGILSRDSRVRTFQLSKNRGLPAKLCLPLYLL